MRTFLGVSIVAGAIAVAGCAAEYEPDCAELPNGAEPYCGHDPTVVVLPVCPDMGIWCVGGRPSVESCVPGGIDNRAYCAYEEPRCARGRPRCVRVEARDCDLSGLLYCR